MNTTQKPLTRSMMMVLAIAARDGGAVVAGRSEHRGSVESVSAVTIGALVAYGLMTRHFSPDGGVAGRLTPAGTKLALPAGWSTIGDGWNR